MTKQQLKKDLAIFESHLKKLATQREAYIDLLGKTQYWELVDSTLDKINEIKAILKSK